MASPRQSVLASRHKALGSPLGDWNGMDVPWAYDQDVSDENNAVHTAAGLFDVSGIKNVHITGPDALEVANHVCTRDLKKLLYPGKAELAIILNEQGEITDDCMMFYIMPNHLMMLHGGGNAMEQLQKSAEGNDVSIWLDDDIHNLSLQGPKSMKFLDEYTPYNLPELKNFHHVHTTIFGRACTLSRTGYSNERGYEILAKAEDICFIWDSILEHGRSEGIHPCSFNCIDLHRVEAGLYFFPYDMEEHDTPWDVGYDFAVSIDKQDDYRGKKALLAAKGKATTTIWSIIADHDKAVEADAGIFDGDIKVGRVLAPVFSDYMKKSIALVRIDRKYAEASKKLTIMGPKVTCSATTGTMPLNKPRG